MMLLFKRNSENIPDLYILARDLNIKRANIAAYFIIVFQIIDRTLHLICDIAWITYYSYALIVLSVLYLILSYVLRYANMNRNADIPYIICKGYWLMFLIIMGGYYTLDIVYTGIPLNVMITGALFLIIPVYINFTNVFFFSAFTVYNIGLCFVSGADMQYTLSIIILCLTCLCLSFFTQKQFLDTIMLLKKENRIDFLTNVLNRRGGIEKTLAILELCKRHRGIAAVFMADIDNFKKYNDTLGHIKGDEALKAVAEAFSDVFSRSSDAVCRYGGEEFLVCSSVKCAEDADMLAEDARNAIRNKKITFGDDFLTISIGYTVCIAAECHHDVNEFVLIEEADSALYAAKQKGKDRVERFQK